MYAAARKLNLLEDILKLKDEAALIKIERLVKRDAKKRNAGRPSAREFLGIWSTEDAEAIERAIKKACG